MFPLRVIQKNVHGSPEIMSKVIEEAGYLTEILPLQEPFDPAGKTKEYLRHYNLFFGCNDHANARAVIAMQSNIRATAVKEYRNEDCVCVKVELPIKTANEKKLTTVVYFVYLNWQCQSHVANLERIIVKLSDKMIFVILDTPGLYSRDDVRQVANNSRELFLNFIGKRIKRIQLTYAGDDGCDDCIALTLLAKKSRPLLEGSKSVTKVYATCPPLQYHQFQIKIT